MCSLPHGGESCASDSHVDVECTIVRPSVTGLWVDSVRKGRPLRSERGRCRYGLYKKQQTSIFRDQNQARCQRRNVYLANTTNNRKMIVTSR